MGWVYRDCNDHGFCFQNLNVIFGERSLWIYEGDFQLKWNFSERRGFGRLAKVSVSNGG